MRYWERWKRNMNPSHLTSWTRFCFYRQKQSDNESIWLYSGVEEIGEFFGGRPSRQVGEWPKQREYTEEIADGVGTCLSVRGQVALSDETATSKVSLLLVSSLTAYSQRTSPSVCKVSEHGQQLQRSIKCYRGGKSDHLLPCVYSWLANAIMWNVSWHLASLRAATETYRKGDPLLSYQVCVEEVWRSEDMKFILNHLDTMSGQTYVYIWLTTRQ